MKQSNLLVQFSVNDVDLDSLSECAEQILAKEEAVLVIGGHLQHSSLLDKQKIYQALEPRLLLLLEGEADLCVNLQDTHFEKGSIALVARDTIFEMKHISDDACARWSFSGRITKRSRTLFSPHRPRNSNAWCI